MMHRIIFYYLVKHCPISIIFGRLIRKGCWLKIFQFPPHPIFCFYNYLGKQNTHFCVIERPTLSITHQNTFSLLTSDFFQFSYTSSYSSTVNVRNVTHVCEHTLAVASSTRQLAVSTMFCCSLLQASISRCLSSSRLLMRVLYTRCCMTPQIL